MLDEVLHVKIADFGLCRDVYESGDAYEARTTRDLPLRWMSLEAIETGYFTMESDVVCCHCMVVVVFYPK